MNEKVILIGGGGHASSLFENFSENIEGYHALAPSDNLDLDWLGPDSEINTHKDPQFRYHMAIVYYGPTNMNFRKEMIEKLKIKGVVFKSLISPLAKVTEHSKIGDGSAVMPGVIINKSQVGENVIVNTGVIIEHDCKIGDNVFIGPGTVIGGYVTIGSDTFVGMGCCIRNGVKISEGVTIGMGSIVVKDITKPGTYYGII